METLEKKCEYNQCDKTFVPDKFHPNKKFCSRICTEKHRRQQQKITLGNLMKPKQEDDEPVKRSTLATPITANTDLLTKTILDFKEKEITRMETAYNEERSKRKKLKAENETLRTELAEIKTNNRIKEIEDAKPSGLSGILPGGIQGLLDNPHIGPVIGGLLSRIMAPGGAELGGNSAANGFITWFESQQEDVKTNFAELVDGLSKTEPGQLADTIKRMVTLLSAGTTINNANPTDYKQSASYAYS